MPDSDVPVKTTLGLQELRQRTQGLGQRYRTVLLLVDGRRTLGEILSMAHKAGADASHWERLVALGLVELPPAVVAELPPVPAPEVHAEPPPSQVPVAADDGPRASVDLPPPGHAEPPAAVQEIAAPAPVPSPAIAAPAATVPGSTDGPAPIVPAAHSPEVVIAVAAAEPELPLGDEDTLAEVRRLLLEALRRDTLLARIFAPARVRGARTHVELISLVWEIERERTHPNRKRSQLLALLRARELLGMGNTIVAEDSLPAPPSEF